MAGGTTQTRSVPSRPVSTRPGSSALANSKMSQDLRDLALMQLARIHYQVRQNRNAIHLEFQITSRWEIEAEYGDLGTGTGDLMWKKNY